MRYGIIIDRFPTLTGLALVAAGMFPASAMAGAVHPVSNTALCLDVAWGANTDGAAVQIATCNGGAGQNWTYANGMLSVFGNKCLDVTGGANADGTALQIYDCGSTNANQQWTVVGQALQWNNSNRCVDVPNNNATDGQHLRLWGCNQSPAQNFAGLPAPSAGSGSSAGSTPVAAGAVKSVTNASVCLDIIGGAGTSGAGIQVANCSGVAAQTWTYDGTNLKAFGKCLDVPYANDSAGTLVQLWDCNGSAAQKWTHNGQTLVWAGGTNKCLDIPNNNATDGQRIQIWGCNNSAAQTWNLTGSGGGSSGGGSTSVWNLVWSDEFNGNALDTSKWNVEVNCSGGGNNEDECYVNSTNNISVANGVLSLNVIKQNYGGKAYTSGRINTSNKATWTYGRFETRLKVPCGQGFWPAAWMMPNDSVYGSWPTSGELDIMEVLGGNPSELFGTTHYGPVWPNNKQSGGTYTMPSGNFCGDYHVFALEWYADHVTFFVDGNAYYTLTNTGANWSPLSHWPFDQRFFFILNVAMGGDWPGAPDPSIQSGSMQVDYVRAYQHK